MNLTFAYSPCPNDTFTFCGIASKRVTLEGPSISVVHHDIETLNQLALRGRHEITKLSFHAWLLLGDRYRLLQAGNALGHGCGPVLVSRRPVQREELSGLRVVLPGEHTTAHLLLRLYCPEAARRSFTTYDRIFSEILADRADCGVVIHESRFLYEQAGLHKVCDLGQWWEETTRSPIPLGAIAVRADVPPALDAALEQLIRRSLLLARSDPAATSPYVRQMACELDDGVIGKQIDRFVNDFTVDLGEQGMRAVNQLRKLATAAGVVP
ncbi:MAG: 1,4-dihydroxy-6-naphthoate synthase [bacterium]